MITAKNKARTEFLAGAGEMGSRIRAFDWRRTSLGPITDWTDSLKTSVSLILGSRHPMWIGWGPQMTFLYNDAYLHVLGAAKHPKALGRPASEVWAEIWPIISPLANKVFEKGEASFVDDLRLFMDRGLYLEETFYSFSYSPIRDESGSVCGLFCPSTDVTPKVVNARRLATLSELASNALLEKTVAAACATAARTLRKDIDDVPFALLYLVDAEGIAILEQATGDFAPDFAQASCVSLEQDSCSWPIAAVYRSARREVIDVRGISGLPRGAADQRVVEAVVLPVASAGEHKPYGVLVAGVNPGRPLDADHLTFFELVAGQVATAIQNARATEEERRRADMLAEIDRAKTVFFSNVSHEFRTPLTLMLGPLENLLAKPERLTEEDHNEISTAHRNSMRLLKLVNSLLDFARLEAGRLQATYTPVDLAHFTADLASNFRSAMQAAGLELIVECGPLPEDVYIDRELWEKVVLNLLSNAFKFTFEGCIAVRLRADGGNAVLTVVDTGIGIPEKELPHIFERFFRVEGARGRTYEGTGIGLALIQEYVKLHAGSIEAESKAGEGSKFTVRIPFGKGHLDPARIGERAQPADAAAPPLEPFVQEAISWLPRTANTAAAAAAQPVAKLRVLVADDNADMREHVRRLLGDDYQIASANNGREALDAIRSDPPDLVLSDIMMPVMNGLELLRELREDPELRTIPVIFISARAGEELRIEGLNAGADDYLVKPFTAGELRARVQSQIRSAIARREAMHREAALRAEAEAARDQAVSVLESISDGFIAFDQDWRITYVNAVGVRLSRLIREEIIGRTYREVFPESAGTTADRELDRAAAERVPVDFETFHQAWQRWFHVKAYPAANGGVSVFFEDITARKLGESEAMLLSSIVDSSDDAIISKDLNGVITSWNPSAERVFGYASDEAVGKTVAELLIPPDRQDEETQILDRLRHGERVDHFETIRKHKDGRLLDVSLTISPVRDQSGHIIGASKIARDISDRKRAETAIEVLNTQLTGELSAMMRMQKLSTRLVGAEEFTQLLADILDAAGEITGADMGNIQLLEDGVLKIVSARGFDRAFLDFFNTVRHGQAACGTALARKERVIVEDVVSSSLYDDASREAVLAAGVRAVQTTPLISRSGELVGMFSTQYRTPQRPGERELRLLDVLARQAADLVERKRVEIALLESEAKFRRLADAMPQIVWTAAAGGAVDYFNERWYEFTGTPRENLGDRAWESVVHPEDFKTNDRIWNEVVQTGEPFQVECRLWDRKEVRWRWFMSRALAVKDQRGKVVKWFGTSTDIDEQKRVENDLRRANQDLEQFAYSASHDLQEPLRSIKIYGELLSKRHGAQLNGEALEFLHFLRAGASRMEVLVRDLLEYTQVTRLDIPAEAADTNEALRASLANLGGAVAESGAAVTYDSLPPLRLHSTHLRQLFQNLIGNAIKYRHRDRSPRIHVSAERETGAWVISVRDNGIGIKTEYKEHIFGLFKRLHSGDDYSGTGIGLAICQRIVDRYYGRIWVESEPGEGSVFRFSIPL